MKTPALRNLRVLLILLVPCPVGFGQEEAPDPDGVLGARGLSRSGKTYVLGGEDEFRKRWSAFRPSFEGLVAEYQAIMATRRERARVSSLDDELTRVNGEIDVLNAKIDANPVAGAMNSRMFQRRRALLQTRTQMVARRGALQAEIAQSRKRLPDRARAQQRFQAFNSRRERFLRETGDLAPLVDRVSKRYAELSKEAGVTEALKSLRTSTKVHYNLGPSDAFKKAVREFKESRRVVE